MIRPGLVLALYPCAILLGFGQVLTDLPPAAAPTIRTTASEVLLDLVVRDKHGKPVKNLKPAEVQIFEDGVQRELTSLRFVGLKEIRGRAPAGAGQSAAVMVASSRPLHTVNLICLVLHNLDPASRPRAIEAIQEFLKNELQPNTFVGLFLLDD